MPNNYLSVLYQHIIQVKNKNVGLKVEVHKHTIAPPSQKSGGAHAPLAPRFLRQWYIYTHRQNILNPFITNWSSSPEHHYAVYFR